MGLRQTFVIPNDFLSYQMPYLIQKQPGFLRKGVLKICSNFTGKHPCQNVISIKLLCNFIEIALLDFVKSHFGMGVLP